jgi:NAD(P)H dehydrogenase (quinone)
MSGILVLYHSRTGNTEKMARAVAEAVKEMGVDVSLARAAGFKAEMLKDFAGLAIGSPTYYGTMAWEVKKVFDDSVKLHGELEGRVGGAFTSSANLAGGNETTILEILHAMLVHGMVVQGTHTGDHYGPVAIGAPDKRALDGCRSLGRRMARLVKATMGDNLAD